MKESRKFSKQVMKRFKLNSLCIFTAMLCAGTTLAQSMSPDTISVDELEEQFYKSYPPDFSTTPPKGSLAAQYCFDTSELKCPLPSGTSFRPVWEVAFDTIADRLCLGISDFVDTKNGTKDTLLLQKFRNKYAPAIENNVVCARWLTGTFRYLKQPVPYFSYMVSRALEYIKIEHGIFGNVEKGMYPLPRDGYYYNEAFFIDRHTDGHWMDEIRMAMILFSHDMTNACPPDTFSVGSRYSLLLTIDRDKKCDVRVLYPRRLNAADSCRFEALRKAVRALRPGAFYSLFTQDGRVFPARYFQAYCGGRRWRIMDYLQLSPLLPYSRLWRLRGDWKPYKWN